MNLKKIFTGLLLAVLSFAAKAQVLSSYSHQLINNQYTLSEYSRIGDSVYYHVRVTPFSAYLADPGHSDNWVAFEIFDLNANASIPLAGGLYIDFDAQSFPSMSGTDYYGVIDVSGVSDLSQCDIWTGWSIFYEDPNSPSEYALDPNIHFNIYGSSTVAALE